MLSDKILRRIFRRFYRLRLKEMVAPDYALVLDFTNQTHSSSNVRKIAYFICLYVVELVKSITK